MEKLADKTTEREALKFIQQSIGCNCLVFLSNTPLWGLLVENGAISLDQIEATSVNRESYDAVFATLEDIGVLCHDMDGYSLSDLGRRLIDYIGLINMLFDGYAPIFSQQALIARSSAAIKKEFLIPNGAAIAQSSIQFGKRTLDPIILKEFSNLNIPGTVCDLGAGSCTKLAEICQATGRPGLGIDNCQAAIEQANDLIECKNLPVTSVYGDITCLEGVWEDVVILMQCFVFHDFAPEAICISILNSYLINFPNLKYFFYVDIVAPSSSCPDMMPGYDYVHGLMGIRTRAYEATMDMFSKSNFMIVKERKIPSLPNTFLWILSPFKNL